MRKREIPYILNKEKKEKKKRVEKLKSGHDKKYMYIQRNIK